MDIPEGKFIAEMLKKVIFGIDENGCFIISGNTTAKNPETNKLRYHTMRIEGKVVKTHRYSYEKYYNEQIPKGKIIRHKCDNPRCINPFHLEVGTRADNARDMVQRRRWKGKGELIQLGDSEKAVAKVLLKEKPPEEVADLLRVSKTVIFELINAPE
jgi:hypothetical protein